MSFYEFETAYRFDDSGSKNTMCKCVNQTDIFINVLLFLILKLLYYSKVKDHIGQIVYMAKLQPLVRHMVY